jgi:hypothetical protein
VFEECRVSGCNLALYALAGRSPHREFLAYWRIHFLMFRYHVMKESAIGVRRVQLIVGGL